MSRKGKKFHQFDPLLKQALRSLKGQRAILDGESVVLDADGRSDFHELMARRGEPRYYAFDLLWLNGRDLRAQPLLERKRKLRRIRIVACLPAEGWSRFNPRRRTQEEHLTSPEGSDTQAFFAALC